MAGFKIYKRNNAPGLEMRKEENGWSDTDNSFR